MSYLEEEEEQDGVPITKKAIKASVKKHSLYNTPDLNDVLYLHYQGFTRIQKLDKYVNLKALWLNNNAITKIEGLSELRNLTCLYLQSNLIDCISGLENLTKLDTLALSHNFISRIEGIENCPVLTSVELDHNKFRTPEALSGLLAAPAIKLLNLNDNIIESEEFLEVIKGLTQLRVLRMTGNPVTRQMKNYRRRIVLAFEDLRFLDDAPVDEDERRCTLAWSRGGREEEKAEREKIKAEKENLRAENARKFHEMLKKPAPEVFVTSGALDVADVD
jgi:dynein assembly factor 1